MSNEIINGFVSHFHEDEGAIGRMQSLLGDRVTLRNGSVTTDKYNNAHNPDYIKSMLRSRIQSGRRRYGRRSGRFSVHW